MDGCERASIDGGQAGVGIGTGQQHNAGTGVFGQGEAAAHHTRQGELRTGAGIHSAIARHAYRARQAASAAAGFERPANERNRLGTNRGSNIETAAGVDGNTTRRRAQRSGMDGCERASIDGGQAGVAVGTGKDHAAGPR